MKKFAFGILVLIAIAAAIIGCYFNSKFFADVWSQIFWLSVGTIITVFLLESILENAEKQRKKKADGFAFRVFIANIFQAINSIFGHYAVDKELFAAAIEGGEKFAEITGKINKSLKRSENFIPHEYLRVYLDISSAIRDISRNYIRLFSANEGEMLQNYLDLNKLASQWKYFDEFSDSARAYLSSLEGKERDEQEGMLIEAIKNIKNIIFSTSEELTKIVKRSSEGKTYYP